MASLKSYTDRLAPILGTTPALLYERQRRLVRDGILRPAKEGRGPGNGVIATPISVCYLLIAALSGNDLENASDRAVKLAGATKTRGKQLFKTALNDLLACPGPSCNLIGVTISQSSIWAQIHRRGSGRVTLLDTYVGEDKTDPPVKILSHIEGGVICDIANWLAADKEPS